MKQEKKLWARAVPAVAFGILMSFAVLVHTPVNADENSAAEPSDEANQLMLAQGDSPIPAKISRMIPSKGSMKKCFGSTEKLWIVTF